MTELLLNCGAASDTGLVRESNEDRFWIDPARGAFLVVDGVGGQAAGERAAELAVAAIQGSICVDRPQKTMACSTVRRAIASANNRICAAAQEDAELAGMACVLTLALVDGERLTIGHVGDSRLYLIGAGAIHKLTSDHSPVGELEDAGGLTEEEAMAHPLRNEVYRDVGSYLRSADERGFIDVLQCEFPSDAAMLLCSDGLSDHLTSLQIRQIVERFSGDADRTARDLVAAANRAGGRDNITAVFVAGPSYRGGSGVTRARLGVTRVRPPRAIWSGRLALLSYGLLLGMLLWAALHGRG